MGIEEDTEGMVIVKTLRAHTAGGNLWATIDRYHSAWIPVNEDDIDMMHNTRVQLPPSVPVEVMRQTLDYLR